MTLAEILRVKGSTVHTISPDASLEEATRELVKHNIGALVVCDRDLDVGERLLGIISERDVARACASGGASFAAIKVADVMTAELHTGTPHDTVEATMGLMTKSRVRHLPILSGGRLVGLVSIGDVVKSQIEQLAVENQFMKHYITG